MPRVEEDYLKVAAKLDDQIRQVIGPSQKEAVEKLRDIHNKHGGAEAFKCVQENVAKAIEGYMNLKNAIERVSLFIRIWIFVDIFKFY
jgi:hypothetical protein